MTEPPPALIQALERLRRLNVVYVVAAAAIAIASAYTAWLVWFAVTHSSFHGRGDDVEGFWMSKHLPFWSYLFSPIEVHLIPLHRLVSYFLFRAAPLNFTAAVLALLAFHLLGCFFLLAALDQVRRTPWNYVLVSCYAVNVYLGPQFFWWGAGLHRLPYLLFSNAATFYYLKFRKDGTRRSFTLVITSVVLALGFFAKGVLIPVQLIALEIVLAWGEAEPTIVSRPRIWTLLAVASTISVAYFVAWRAATPPSLRQANLDPGFLFLYVKWSWTVFGLGTTGFLFEDAPLVGSWVGLAWGAVFAWSVVRTRVSLVAWAAAALLISLNVYSGTSQSRAHLLGPFTALLADRYYFELTPVLVLFGAVVLARVRLSPTERAFFRPPLASRAAAALLVALLCLLGANSKRGVRRVFDARYSEASYASVFFRNLRHDLKGVVRSEGGTWPLVDSRVPHDLLMTVAHPSKNSELLELIGEHPRVVGPGPGAYWVTQNGHVVRL